MMSPIEVDDQIDASSLIVEGEVVSKRCFIPALAADIYTAYAIRITRIFKGQTDQTELEIVRKGGQLNGKVDQVTPTVELEVGVMATFMLKPLNPYIAKSMSPSKSMTHMFSCYANSQSVFIYNSMTDQVSGVFSAASDRITKWYPRLERKIGQVSKLVAALPKNESYNRSAAPTISTLSPATITAGTFSELTITGSGFGASRGSSTVLFRNADDQNVSYIVATAFHYVSWSATSIVVLVPNKAGTGNIQVDLGGGMIGTSPSSITIPYAEYTFETGTELNQWCHASAGTAASGGYVFQYHTDFANNAPAVASFERALKSWQCGAGVNYTIGATTTIDATVMDLVNVVRFDNGTELDPGVLGQATTRLDCYAASIQKGPAYEIDIRFDDGSAWEYGPTLPSGSEIDFETVALHELGHATLLGHVLNTGDLMYPALDFGDHNRTLGTGDIDGAADVYVRSKFYNFTGCGNIVGAATNFDPNTTALCKNFAVVLNYGIGVLDPSQIDNGSSSLCGHTLAANQTIFTCADIGIKNVTLTVTDQGSTMTTSTCVAAVTVSENVLPTVGCQDAWVQLPVSGVYNLPLTIIEDFSNDDCGITSSTLSIPTVNTSHIGINNVTYTVQDGSGNSASCSANIYVYPYATTLYVNDDATGAKSGESWTNAIDKLSDALKVAVEGDVDTIKMAAGTYYPDEGFITSSDDRNSTFNFPPSLVIVGGYNATTGIRDLTGNSTILSGEIQQDNDISNNSYSIITNSSNPGPILNGLIIEKGSANGPNSPNPLRTGGAIYNSGTMTAINCQFNNNEASGTNGIGGAIISFNGPMNLINCLFYNNLAGANGGAISIENGGATILNCTFTNNTANKGGAIHTYGGQFHIKNTILANNTANINPDINDDTPGTSGTITASNSLFDNALPANVVDGGSNQVLTDPMFFDEIAADFTLRYGSLALNSGAPNASLPPLDLNGKVRVLSSIVDMGSYEFHYSFPCNAYGILSIDENPIYGSEYKASSGILSSGSITNMTTSEVIFNSVNTIELLAGFKVDIGGEFKAIVENPCVD